MNAFVMFVAITIWGKAGVHYPVGTVDFTAEFSSLALCTEAMAIINKDLTEYAEAEGHKLDFMLFECIRK